MDFNNFEMPKKVGEENKEVVEQVKQETTNNNISEVPNMIDDLKENINVQKKSFGNFFKDSFKYLTTRNTKDLFELLWRVAMIAIFILLLYVPVELIQNLLLDFLITMGIELNERMQSIYFAIFHGTYSLIALVLFFVVIKERFYKYVSEEDRNKALKK